MCLNLPVFASTSGLNLSASITEGQVDLTLITLAEEDTAAFVIFREEKLDGGGTLIEIVCNLPSGGSPYTCTDFVVGDNYGVLEVEYDGSVIIYNTIIPK